MSHAFTVTNEPYPGEHDSKDARSKGYSMALRALEPGQCVHLPCRVGVARNLIRSFYFRNERVKGEFRAMADGRSCKVWRITST